MAKASRYMLWPSGHQAGNHHSIVSSNLLALMADDFALRWSLLLAGIAGAGPCSPCQSGTYFTGSGLLWGCIVVDEHNVN